MQNQVETAAAYTNTDHITSKTIQYLFDRTFRKWWKKYVLPDTIYVLYLSIYSWIELRAEPYRTESSQKSIEFECHLMMLALNAQYIHILNIMILMYKGNWCCRESSDEDYHCGGGIVVTR